MFNSYVPYNANKLYSSGVGPAEDIAGLPYHFKTNRYQTDENVLDAVRSWDKCGYGVVVQDGQGDVSGVVPQRSWAASFHPARNKAINDQFKLTTYNVAPTFIVPDKPKIGWSPQAQTAGPKPGWLFL